MCDARYGRYSDLETRGITLAVILEILAAAYGQQKGKIVRMPNTAFKKGRKQWQLVVRNALSEAYPGRTDLASMVTFITSGLNRIPFADRILAMAEEFGISPGPISLEKQVAQVVETRNKLIHDASFKAQGRQAVAEFFSLMEFVDRVILKLLGYSGEYMGWRDHQLVEKTLP